MKVTFCPSVNQVSGVVSFASWSNPDLLKGIRQIFKEAPHEQIREVVVDSRGITAIFEARRGLVHD